VSTTTTLDWNQSYLDGEHHSYWELSCPSPDLIGFLVGRRAGPGAAALDLGCGTGWDTVALARAGYRTVGLDISPEALRIAVGRAAEARVTTEFRVGDARDMSLPPESFDLVIDRGCFHHFGAADRERYVAEVGRVLRPGGELYLRGSVREVFPFKPVTAEHVYRHFPPPTFTLEQIMPFMLVTDAMQLEANACLIRRH
jgi:SAM-dependent methyltransferase